MCTLCMLAKIRTFPTSINGNILKCRWPCNLLSEWRVVHHWDQVTYNYPVCHTWHFLLCQDSTCFACFLSHSIWIQVTVVTQMRRDRSFRKSWWNRACTVDGNRFHQNPSRWLWEHLKQLLGLLIQCIQLRLMSWLGCIIIDHFNGLARAISWVCVCVCAWSLTYKRNDIW